MHGRKLTVLPDTGLTVGQTKIMLTNNVQRHAHKFTKGLSLPICQGPGSNFPKASLQLVKSVCYTLRQGTQNAYMIGIQ